MEEVKTLPERPSLEQLRNQARELQMGRGIPLSQAQLELARSYGFPSWPRLKHHVEEMLGLRARLEAFVEAALGGRVEEAERILAAHPALLEEPAAVCLTGDIARIGRIDPLAIYPPRGFTPLLYVCFSRLPQRARLARCAQSLLQRGADPNAHWNMPEYPESDETCLYGATGRNNDPELGRILLDHGANPTDNEALYHSTEHGDLKCLHLLLEAGGEIRGQNALLHMLDRDDLAGLRLVLQHWGEPDEELHRALHGALMRRRSPEHLAMLVDSGADPDFRHHGVSAYVRSRLLGARENADLLARRGASTEMDPAERYVAALVEGEAGDPVEVPEELGFAMAEAAQWGRLEALRRLLAAGMDPNGLNGLEVPALHAAGYRGHGSSVRTLLQHGARLDLRDRAHNGTPLNWTVFGYRENANPNGDYFEAVEAMLQAGAAEHCSPPWLRVLTEDKPEMRALLERFLG
jgi:hypothetical protein